MLQHDIMSVKLKLNVKSLGKKYQAMKDLESGLSNNEVAKQNNIGHLKTHQRGLKTKRRILAH